MDRFKLLKEFVGAVCELKLLFCSLWKVAGFLVMIILTFEIYFLGTGLESQSGNYSVILEVTYIFHIKEMNKEKSNHPGNLPLLLGRFCPTQTNEMYQCSISFCHGLDLKSEEYYQECILNKTSVNTHTHTSINLSF